jgi:hypothetical protein
MQAGPDIVECNIVDFYSKTERRLSQLEKEEGYVFQRDVFSSGKTDRLFKAIADSAQSNKMEIYCCAEEKDLRHLGIPPGKCIDDRLLHRIGVSNIKYKKDPYQRKSCFCLSSKDIGINDTCMHGCPYCYATAHYEVARRRFDEHDPTSPILWGRIEKLPELVKKTNAQM